MSTLPGVHATVDQVVRAIDMPGTKEKPHRFVYFVTIHNDGDQPVTVKGRKWVIREQDGETSVIEASGVVGETPRLEPGDSFNYNSSHVVASNATAEGAYIAATDSGDPVLIPISPFALQID